MATDKLTTGSDLPKRLQYAVLRLLLMFPLSKCFAKHSTVVQHSNWSLRLWLFFECVGTMYCELYSWNSLPFSTFHNCNSMWDHKIIMKEPEQSYFPLNIDKIHWYDHMKIQSNLRGNMISSKCQLSVRISCCYCFVFA